MTANTPWPLGSFGVEFEGMSELMYAAIFSRTALGSSVSRCFSSLGADGSCASGTPPRD